MTKVTTRSVKRQRGNHPNKGASTARLAVIAVASVAAFGMSAGPAAAGFDYGDAAVLDTVGPFRLNPSTLEPGCQLAPTMSELKLSAAEALAHIDVTQKSSEAHVKVLDDADFSVDQVLVPGKGAGYKVYNGFDTGSETPALDSDIDPGQVATDLAGPGGTEAVAGGIILCVSDHPNGDQNEPYTEDRVAGEVAAINRPIIQPTIAALGVSALTKQNTYKVGFGYSVERGYNSFWRLAFGGGGDPHGGDLDVNGALDHVWIDPRAEQGGVRRYNDMDEVGEQFNSGAEKVSYGQPFLFDVSGNGDPQAYLHKSKPGTVDGGTPLDSIKEAAADQTDSEGLHTFSAQGDLPLSWAVKASLAPEAYGRKVTLTDDTLRAWHKSWQDFYAGKGAKPSIPLAPGTNSPAVDPTITNVVNLPEMRPNLGPQTTTTTTVNNTVVKPAPKVKTKVLATRLMRTKKGRVVQVFVRSEDSAAHIQLRMFDANGRRLGVTSRMVATNRLTRVPNLRIGARVKTVRASAAG